MFLPPIVVSRALYVPAVRRMPSGPTEAKSPVQGFVSSSPSSSVAGPDGAVLDDRQRLAEHGFLHAPERAAVADDEHASVGVARCDCAEGARDSLGVTLVRLAVPRASVDLRFRQPLP